MGENVSRAILLTCIGNDLAVCINQETPDSRVPARLRFFSKLKTSAWAKAVDLFGEKPVGEWREKSVADVIRFRDKLREIIITLVETKDISDADIAWINKALGRKSGHLELV